MFRVGQEVVCIKDDWFALAPGAPPLPICNEIYVVSSISNMRFGHRSYDLFTLRDFPSDWRYSVDNFRPVVKTKTDISIFEAMLTPSPHKITAK